MLSLLAVNDNIVNDDCDDKLTDWKTGKKTKQHKKITIQSKHNQIYFLLFFQPIVSAHFIIN